MARAKGKRRISYSMGAYTGRRAAQSRRNYYNMTRRKSMGGSGG